MVRCRGGISGGPGCGDNSRGGGHSGGRGRGDSSRGGGHSGGRGRGDSSRGGHSGGRGLVPPQGDRPLDGSSIFTSGRRTLDHEAFSGSSSRGGSGDPMADMHGALREQRSRVISSYESGHYSDDANYGDGDYEDSDHEYDTNHPSQHNSYVGDALHNTSRRRLIKRSSGDGFVNVHGDVHKSISRILREHHDGAWLTFKQVPRDEVALMYDRFRTCWTWDPSSEQAIYEGFLNMLKKRFREIMMQLRKKATRLAYKAGENVDLSNSNQFRIIRKYPPESIPINIWRDMCSLISTHRWIYGFR